MTVNRTTLLDLPLPVTGTESGTWGDITNNGLSQYLDIAVAGALSITGSVTLALTEGDASATNIASTTAQYRTLIVPASGPSANVVITAPSSNRTYHVVNLNATYTVQIRAGANSGVTLGVSQSATVTYDSVAADYVLVGTIGPTVPVARGGTGATTLTGVLKGNGTSAFTAATAGTDYVAPGGALGTPASGTLTNATGLPISTGVSGLGTGVATFLATPSSANLASAVTDETGSGALVFATSPTLVTPALGTPASGTLSGCTVDGTDSVGFRNLPINSQSANYTLVLADSGKTILHPASDTNARTFTIPAASSVAFPLGTAVTFINLTSQVVTIAITTDTMYLSSAGTTGSRSLAQYGSATAIKVSGLSSSGVWLISGSGLT